MRWPLKQLPYEGCTFRLPGSSDAWNLRRPQPNQNTTAVRDGVKCVEVENERGERKFVDWETRVEIVSLHPIYVVKLNDFYLQGAIHDSSEWVKQAEDAMVFPTHGAADEYAKEHGISGHRVLTNVT